MISMMSGDRGSSFTSRQVSRRKALAATVSVGLALSDLARSAGAASGVGIRESPEQLRSAYDYVIVGAGSSGCVLAHRLGLADDGYSFSRPAAKRSWLPSQTRQNGPSSRAVKLTGAI